MAPKTMFEKLWERHVVVEEEGKPAVLYIDLHMIHEVTSPQAFDGLRMAGRKVRRPDLMVAVMDHNVPTWDRSIPTDDPIAQQQMDTLKKNCQEHGIRLYDIFDNEMGIVHVIGPDKGYTQPGKTIVCGDSHTSTHGAFGALAFGIGTSEVEHVMATQTLLQKKPKTMEIRVNGHLKPGVTAKDIILYIIGQMGTAGATGYAVEYTGEAIRALSMEGRMTVCNMTIEGGGRVGMVAPDEKTFEYLKGRRYAPKDEAWEQAVADWKTLPTDPGAVYDKVVEFDASNIVPQVSWGTNPGHMAAVSDVVPSPADFKDPTVRAGVERALEYMDLKPGQPITSIKIDRVFIGSCTNARIEDLRAAAAVIKGKKVSPHVYAMCVPGSYLVKQLAEQQGLDKIFKDAGFDWLEPSCSLCLGMNPDQLKPGERCASTSNRNFEGRQGKGGRTHLCSPVMAAAAAVAGHFVDIRTWGDN